MASPTRKSSRVAGRAESPDNIAILADHFEQLHQPDNEREHSDELGGEDSEEEEDGKSIASLKEEAHFKPDDLVRLHDLVQDQTGRSKSKNRLYRVIGRYWQSYGTNKVDTDSDKANTNEVQNSVLDLEKKKLDETEDFVGPGIKRGWYYRIRIAEEMVKTWLNGDQFWRHEDRLVMDFDALDRNNEAVDTDLESEYDLSDAGMTSADIEDEARKVREMEIRLLRYKLQRDVDAGSHSPPFNDSTALRDIFGKLEEYEQEYMLDADIIRSTKIDKVLKAWIKLEYFLDYNPFRFRERSSRLLSNWQKTLDQQAVEPACPHQ